MPSRHQNPRVTLGQGLDKEVCDTMTLQVSITSPKSSCLMICRSQWLPGSDLLTQSPQVYQVIRKIVDEESQYGGAASRLTVPVAYDKIKRSNSSLNRKSKKLLIDSIERVLAVSKEEEDDASDDNMASVEGDFAGLGQEDEPAIQVGL